VEEFCGDNEDNSNGYCLVQFLDKRGDGTRRVLSKLWAEPSDERPGRQNVYCWTHEARELVCPLIGNVVPFAADNYMRVRMGLERRERKKVG